MHTGRQLQRCAASDASPITFQHCDGSSKCTPDAGSHVLILLHGVQLPLDKQRSIAEELDRTPGECVKKLEELRNKLL